ncbi:MAG: hypothetical protein HC789_20850 [Microcoleus sp. CSU_2_2]|nr:hypothetical protein [Microcoleus sp. CSU_2_2]
MVDGWNPRLTRISLTPPEAVRCEAPADRAQRLDAFQIFDIVVLVGIPRVGGCEAAIVGTLVTQILRKLRASHFAFS